MDHLPWRRHEHLRPKVACFCHFNNTPSSAASFLPVRQFSIALIVQRGLPQVPPAITDLEQWTSTLQAFFFFHLISAVAHLRHVSISIDELVTDELIPVLRTQMLEKLFNVSQIPENESNEIARLLNTAEAYICYTFQKVPNSRWNKSCFMIFWSLALLHEQLRSKLFEGLESSYAIEIARWIHEHKIFSGMLLQAGWCPTVLRRKAFSLLDSWILLSTPMGSSSFELEQSKLHTGCLGQDCKAFHTDRRTYRTQHLPNCGNTQQCPLRGIDVDRLAKILTAGSIPIVRSIVDSDGIHIDIVSEDGVDFTAISHVWAGGMGNFLENKVYECQLTNLHVSLTPSRSFKGTAYYWLDTLCIPVTDSDDAQRKEAVRMLRDLAINDMARVYASAKSVFALDPLLRHMKLADLNEKEQGILIAASPWMARSWTLQEAALAVRLDIRFLDAMITFGDIDFPDGALSKTQLQSLWFRDVDRLDVGSPLPNLNVGMWLRHLCRMLIRRKINERIPKARKRILSEISSTEEQLAAVWQELCKRNSKEPDDIALILAVFLGNSAGEVAGSKGTKRVYALLRSCGSIPTNLLFTPVEANRGIWEPQLPRCGTVNHDLEISTYLKFTDNDLLEISETQDLAFTPIFDVRKADMLDIIDPGGRRLILKVLFDSESLYPKVTAIEQGLIYIFPRNVLNHAYMFTTNRQYLGISVVKFAQDQEVLHAKYQQTFRWRLATHDEQSRFLQQSNSEGPVQDLSTTELYTDLLATKQLVLDMGVQEWKSLSWHRTQFYPFRGHSIKTAQPLYLLGTLKLFGCFCLLSRIVLWSLVYIPGPPGFGTTPDVTARLQIPRWLLGSNLQGAIVVLRLILGEHEEHQLKNLFRIPLQRVWASSFSTRSSVLNDPGRTAVRVEIHRLIYIGVMYAILLTMAILLFILHVQFIQFNLERERKMGPPEGLGVKAAVYVVASVIGGSTSVLDEGYPWKMVVLSATIPASLWFTVELTLRMAYIMYIIGITYLPHRGSRQPVSNSRPDSDVTDSDDPRLHWMVRTFYLYVGISGLLMPTVLVPILFSIFAIEEKGPSPAKVWTLRAFMILISIFSGVLGIGSLCYAVFDEIPRMPPNPFLPSEQEPAPEPTNLELQPVNPQESNAQEDEQPQEAPKSDSVLMKVTSKGTKLVYRGGKFLIETGIKGVHGVWSGVEWFSKQIGAQKERNRLRRAQERAAEENLELLSTAHYEH